MLLRRCTAFWRAAELFARPEQRQEWEVPLGPEDHEAAEAKIAGLAARQAELEERARQADAALAAAQAEEEQARNAYTCI